MKKLYGLDGHMNRAMMALSSNEPVLLYGPSGSGKTIMAEQLAEKYKKTCKNNIPIIQLQLYPEMTKGTLIGGETLRDGNIVIEPQIISTKGKEGAVFVIDECTHTTEPVLLAFNSLIEDPYITVIGDKEYKMDKETRFIFCGNYHDHTGNIPLPTSFANRLYIVDVGFPPTEEYIKISNYYSKIDPVFIEFLVYIVESTRTDDFPLSPRNIIKCSKAIKSIEKTGFRDIDQNVRLTSRVKSLMSVLEKEDINPNVFKEVILSTLQAHIKSRSNGPDKVKALLW